MPQQVKKVTDMVIDEISLVDRPANQHAHIVIAKRDNQEDAVPTYYRDAEGTIPVELEELEFGDHVFDDQGVEQEYYDASAEDTEQLATAGVAKSAFGAPVSPPPISPSLAALQVELNKALSDGDRDQVLSKALDEIAKFEQRTTAAETLAKSERDLRLNREYISKAAEYNLPVDPVQLGPVLKSMWEAEAEHGVLPKGSCAVIHEALSKAGQILFTELGYEGQTSNAEATDQVEAYIAEQVAKSGTGTSVASATEAFYRDNSRAYDDYLAGLGR